MKAWFGVVGMATAAKEEKKIIASTQEPSKYAGRRDSVQGAHLGSEFIGDTSEAPT